MKHSVPPMEEELERVSLYVIGALEGGEARAFEEHLAQGCALCAAELRAHEPIILALGAILPAAAAPPPGVREKLKIAVRREAIRAGDKAHYHDSNHNQHQHDDGSRETEEKKRQRTSSLTVRAGEGEWREISAGLARKELFVDRERGTITSLYRLAPGAHVPAHRHGGTEECLVLEGDLRTADVSLGPGDYHCAPAGSLHQPLTTTAGALFLIIAASPA